MKTRRVTLALAVSALIAALVSGFSVPPVSQAGQTPVLLNIYLQVPNPIRPLVKRACLDCHSNETTWPWYSRIPPASLLIRHDVTKAREHLNFSSWIGLTPHMPTTNEIQEICDAVSDDVMPPRTYRLMHPGARLSETEKDTFCSWADELRTPAPVLLGGQLQEASAETAKSKAPPAHP